MFMVIIIVTFCSTYLVFRQLAGRAEGLAAVGTLEVLLPGVHQLMHQHLLLPAEQLRAVLALQCWLRKKCHIKWF